MYGFQTIADEFVAIVIATQIMLPSIVLWQDIVEPESCGLPFLVRSGLLESNPELLRFPVYSVRVVVFL